MSVLEDRSALEAIPNTIFFQVAPEFLNLLQIAKVASKVLRIKQKLPKRYRATCG